MFKVSELNLVTYLKHAHICDNCVVRCGFNNVHPKKHPWLKEIGPCAQNLSIMRLDSRINIITWTYMIG